MQISEFKDARQLNFRHWQAGHSPGGRLVHVPGMEEGKIIALDKNCAWEMVQAGDVLVDSDKLIDRQLEKISVSALQALPAF